MYFNLQLLKIMSSYNAKTERPCKDIHRNGLKEEKIIRNYRIIRQNRIIKMIYTRKK